MFDQGVRAIKNVASGIDQQLSDYLDRLKVLKASLQEESAIQCTVTVFRVFDNVERMGQTIDKSRSCIVFLLSTCSNLSFRRCFTGARRPTLRTSRAH